MYIISLRYPSAVWRAIQHLEILVSSGIVHCHFHFLELKETSHKIISFYRVLVAWHEMKVEQPVTRGQHTGFSMVVMLKNEKFFKLPCFFNRCHSAGLILSLLA